MGMIKVHNWTTSKVCVQLAKVVTLNYQQLYSISSATTTDKRTDVWSRDFIIWKINSGQWAVVWAGLWNKRVWADYEQFLRPFFLSFYVQKINLKFVWKYLRVRTENLHRIKVKKVKNKCGKYFLRGEKQVF